ncbi:MAG: hypothetical protein LBL43_01900 [Treponema sp.]|nr:hypothetical protein [Treponema sp.]
MALRLYALAAVLSLLSGGAVFFLFHLFMPSETGEGYTVVSVDAALDDRHIGRLLDSAGLEGYASESTQWIEIDDFGTLRKLPLDTYREEIESFDPRDDGFGERLRAFFVRDGKRFFFIPLGEGAAEGKNLQRLVFSALGDLPFDVEILAPYRPFSLGHLLFLLPAVLAAIFLSGSPSGFAFQVFPLLGFVRGGPSALVPAALLASFWALFRDPLNELFAPSRYPLGFYAGQGFRGHWERLKPYGLNLVLTAAFLFLFGFVLLIGDLPPLPACAGLVSSWGLCFLVRAAEGERQKKAAHVRFNPVFMLPGGVKTVPLLPVASAFGLAVLLSLLAPLLFPVLSYSYSSPSPKEAPAVSDPRFLISPADYEAHIAFERAFSRRPLGSDSRGDGYFHYYLGEDGLIAGTRDEGDGGGPGEEVPSFPLESLMEFLLHYDNRAGEAAPAQFKEWASAALFLAVLIPAFFLKSKKGRRIVESVS